MCQVDSKPFDAVEQGSPEEMAQGRLNIDMNEEDKLLLSAMQELSRSGFTYSRPPFGL